MKRNHLDRPFVGRLKQNPLKWFKQKYDKNNEVVFSEKSWAMATDYIKGNGKKPHASDQEKDRNIKRLHAEKRRKRDAYKH